MLDLILLVIFLMGVTVGLRRGFILQLIHLTGFLVAFIVAVLTYDQLAPKLELWIPFPSMGETSSFNLLFDSVGLDQAYYNAIAFIAIFFGVKILWQIFGSMLDFIAQFPILKQLNRWGGGILGFLESYLIIFVLLYLAALLPIEFIQNHIQNSFLAESMIKHTPILSEKLKDLWFHYMSA
ncbi:MULTISPECIES: CvpA family protein [Bacillus]|uniref:CvpA family protein n=1 Tax=Bacillus TaxID=1386 RepID=UPI0003150663|nr:MULTISPECIES: CvpA family protein [Bacillus]